MRKTSLSLLILERSGVMADKIGLDLGVGMKKHPDGDGFHWVGIDIRKFDGVDFVMNIGKEPLPFGNNTVDYIRSIHTYEHLYPDELFFSIEECFRVLKPTGTLHIEVPKAMTKAYYIHPDHKIGFLEDTFGFFQVPVNAETHDPHGYIKGFWHVSILPTDNPEAVHVDMHPNKKGGKFEYKEIK